MRHPSTLSKFVRLSPRDRLHRWCRQSVLGQRLSRQISGDLELILDQWFGYHLVIIGDDMGLPVDDATRVRHVTRVVSPHEVSTTYLDVAEKVEATRGSGYLIADNEDLPVATESVDVVVMFNCLQLSAEPHRILREIHRVLTPDGHVFIVDANANSLMGWVSSTLRRLNPRQNSTAKPLSLGKLEDWLRLLNFQMAPARHKLTVPLANRGKLGRWFERVDQWLADHNIPIGSYYVLFGNKSVWGYVQEQPLRRVKAKMMGLPVAKPVIGGARGVSSRQSVELVPDK